MSLFTARATLHLRAEQTGEGRHGTPIYGPPTDVESPAWWEPRTSSEDTAAREQYVDGYWLYLPEDAPVTGADAVTLHGVLDQRMEVDGQPGYQPGGFVVEGYIRVAVKRVSG